METKCAAFWKHTNLRNDNNIFPCCRFKTPIQKFDGDLSNVLHSDEYILLRNKSSNGEIIEGCSKCYYEEQSGKQSLRQKFNSEYTTDAVNLEYFEVGFDNICNLTCDGCWEDFSSAWGKKLNLDKTLIIKSTTDVENIPETIKKILFLGGEPLMTTRHIKFLKKIKDKKQVTVEYNTNGTFLLSDELIMLLKDFKSSNFILSIDGYKEVNEKVRSGSKWDDILKFIKQLADNNFNYEINSVMHLNNCFYFKELAEFVKSLGVQWNINVLTYPTHLDIKHVNDKISLFNYISKLEIPNKDYILRHINV
jgi:sulfatase maturation enzyme AslB (radical SAM superfamily)